MLGNTSGRLAASKKPAATCFVLEGKLQVSVQDTGAWADSVSQVNTSQLLSQLGMYDLQAFRVWLQTQRKGCVLSATW